MCVQYKKTNLNLLITRKIILCYVLICYQHMVQEVKKKTVHMEGTWRLESTSAGLHPYKAAIQKQCEGCADTAWDGY